MDTLIFLNGFDMLLFLSFFKSLPMLVPFPWEKRQKTKKHFKVLPRRLVETGGNWFLFWKSVYRPNVVILPTVSFEQV